MRPTPFQAYVRIQLGCDKFCTYCIVPSVRGPEQGRHPDHILAEVKQLAGEGCKEITLLGQTVNSYKFTNGDGRVDRLSDLMYRIQDVAGIERIKFVTSFPKDMTDDLIQAVRDLPKACKYLHVPAQHGHDAMLKRMKRLYTVSFYKEMVARCREAIPGVAISSDFIVGFCGETEDEFATCGELIRYAKFKNSFIFKYSPRPGTKAHELYADDVPEEVKKRRNNDLLAVQSEISAADHQQQLGVRASVLVEGPSKSALKEQGAQAYSEMTQLTGRTMTDHIVVFDGHPRLIGQTVEVRIDEASPWTLFGTVETQEGVEVTGITVPVEAQTPSSRRIELALA